MLIQLCEAIEKKQDFETQLITQRFYTLYSVKEHIRRYIDIAKVDFLNEDVSIMGVDASFDMLKNFLSRVEYICVGVASWFNYDETVSIYGDEEQVLYEVETGEYEILLKGISIAMEIDLIERFSGKFKYAFMDRSIISLIAGINQSISFASKIRNKSKLAQSIIEQYPFILKKLYTILKRAGTILSVKRSSRDEFKQFLLKHTEQHLHEHIKYYTDYEIGFVLLEPSEYVILPLSNHYKFNLPHAEFRDELLHFIEKNGFVIYMKGINNKVYKFEIFNSSFPDEAVYTQTTTDSNELLILNECDRKAKFFLNFFKEKSLIGGYR